MMYVYVCEYKKKIYVKKFVIYEKNTFSISFLASVGVNAVLRSFSLTSSRSQILTVLFDDDGISEKKNIIAFFKLLLHNNYTNTRVVADCEI